MSVFSSFAQFLPSAIQNTIAQHQPPPPNPIAEEAPPPQSRFDPSTDDEGDEEELIQQQSRQMEEQQDDRRKVKSKKERDVAKMATETFIFVRPPPSKSNHPLNLQVQLVPPNARPPSGVAVPPGSEPTTPTSASSMSTDGGRGQALSRTASASSDYSSNTNYACNSTTSFQSMASGESTASSATSSTSSRAARRIIPLYNLQAHNVMTNVIADAGTDAKIAKFQRKGLELIDLAVLEPVEVWGVRSRTGEREAKKQGLQISVDEMGSVVHTGIPMMTNGPARPGTAGNKSLSSFLQPKNQREGSRPTTPSASSSAISLNSNSTHFSSIPQSVAPSTPQHQQFLHPPASAPPHSGTFPSTPTRPQKADNPPSNPINVRGAPPPPAPPPITISTTPTKKSSSPSLFGKFKFNKRSSALNPFAPPPPSEDGVATFQPPNPDRPNEYADFGMAPLAPGDLNAKKLAVESHSPAQGKQHPTASLSPPNSPSSQYSNTPTPTPTTPYHPHRQPQQDEPDDIASPTPTIAPSKPGFMSAALNSLSGSNGNTSPPPLPTGSSPGHGRNLSLTNALSRGKNRFMGGAKGGSGGSSTEREPPSPISSSGPSVPPPPASQPQQQTGNPIAGAKGLFNKIAAGITGDKAGGSNGTDRGGALSNGRNAPNALGMSRESVDSAASAGSGNASAKGPFGRLLQHQSSQQYIGKGGSGSNSSNLAPPGTAASSVTSSPRTSFQATGTPASLVGQGLLSQVPAQGAAAAGVVMPPPQVVVGGGQQQVLDPQQQLQQQQKMTLRQLQLRPPVLGIQPTYVSASQTYAVQTTVPPAQQQYASALSLPPNGSDEGGAGSSTNVSSFNGVPLQKVESYSTFNETDESGSGEAGSINRRRRQSTRSKRDGSTRRESLIFDKESSVGGSSTALASQAPSAVSATQPGAGKERALMYVWLVARWLKKRNPGPPTKNLHGQSVSEASGGAGRARDLFQNILSGRDKDRVNGDKESKRGSWHAGAGIGIPSLGSLGNLNFPQTPTSSSSGQPLVLGPVVGGGFEVRFEWKRAKMKSSKGKNKGDKKENGGDESKRGRKSKAKSEVKARDMVKEEGAGESVDVDSTPRIPQVDSSPRKMSVAERKRLNRSSMASVNSFAEEKEGESPSRNSGSPSRRSTTSTRKKRLSLLRKKKEDDDEEYGGGGDDDEDEESDAEDSETPWVCTLKIRRAEFVKPPGASAVDTITSSPPNGEKEQILRLKVGTLSPTPHHPKVVAMLKIPFPLPDVEVEKMEIVKKKTLFSQNSEQEEKEPYYGLMLTAEDIKDIVCSTGLWLVVREGFGGVGKVNRKGDGWKIRG
ncbi:hypothetical protein MD484_g7656, partial [Candolleomyces efflorescens]